MPLARATVAEHAAAEFFAERSAAWFFAERSAAWFFAERSAAWFFAERSAAWFFAERSAAEMIHLKLPRETVLVAMALLLATSCGGEKCVDNSPLSRVLAFSLRGTFGDGDVSFLVNDIVRSGDDDPTDNLGSVYIERAQGVAAVIVAIGDGGVAVVDLRGAARGENAVEAGAVGLSLTGEPGGSASSGQVTIDSLGTNSVDGTFDVEFAGRPATGQFRVEEIEEAPGCV